MFVKFFKIAILSFTLLSSLNSLNAWERESINQNHISVFWQLHNSIIVGNFDRAIRFIDQKECFKVGTLPDMLRKRMLYRYSDDYKWLEARAFQYAWDIQPFQQRNKGSELGLLELAIIFNAPVELIERLLAKESDYNLINVNYRRVTAIGVEADGEITKIFIELRTPLFAAFTNTQKILKEIEVLNADHILDADYSEKLSKFNSKLQNSVGIIDLLVNLGADTDHIKWEGYFLDSQNENGWYNWVEGSWQPIDLYSNINF
ncbi:MAG TPA: hypothetical protein VGP47_10280 [Parachlamydiaceae bacterium]|nr:hypothetical protein [Nitrosopumilus sp.]HEV8052870.1 hypothetical protein [Parachlamydiaceae bacterium]